jgi:hypothetical protein
VKLKLTSKWHQSFVNQTYVASFFRHRLTALRLVQAASDLRTKLHQGHLSSTRRAVERVTKGAKVALVKEARVDQSVQSGRAEILQVL